MSVNSALIKAANQVQAGAEILMAKTRDWQVIRNYLSNRLANIELTDEQQKKLDRYQYSYNQLVTGKYTDSEVVSQLTRIYQIKQSQAYEDLSCTRELFNTVCNINKRFEINLQLQINRKLLRKAEELNDLKAYAQLEKNRALLLKLLPEEEDTPAEHFEGHDIEAVFDPKLLGAPDIDIADILKVINEKRKVKIDIDAFITDIPHEDISTDEETAPLQ